jgi:hypothetical protein
MAITYLAGERIQCLSGDTKPTNVSVGSHLIETNTRKQYEYYDGTGTTMPSAATGGTITTVGDYKVHSFTSDGTFTITARLSKEPLEILVIGGGAGGSYAQGLTGNHTKDGGGGGAGGFREVVRQDLISGTTIGGNADSFEIDVGTGGANYTSGITTYCFKDTTAEIKSTLGGRAGAQAINWAHVGGGSGGGKNSAKGNLGQFVPPEGYAGGNVAGGVSGSTHGGGGGGGGASNFGGSTGGLSGGNGGDGRSSIITGTLKWYCGGGGGTHATCETATADGTGGLGGGGDGGGGNDAAASGDNAGYGSGGGAGNASYPTGGEGFDGIVIIRYRFQNFKQWRDVSKAFTQSYARDRYQAKYNQLDGVYY